MESTVPYKNLRQWKQLHEPLHFKGTASSFANVAGKRQASHKTLRENLRMCYRGGTATENTD